MITKWRFCHQKIFCSLDTASLWYEIALEQRMVGQQTKYEASLLFWGVPAKRDGVLSDTNLQ